MAGTEAKRSPARSIIPLAILFIFLAFCGALAVVFLGAAVRHEASTARGTVLELRLSDELSESPDAIGSLFPGFAGPPSLFEIRKALEEAAEDGNVAGLKLDIERAQVGWAQAQELLAVLDAFRRAHKPVHAFLRGDMVTDVEYAVALGADRVWLAPTAAVAVNGFRAEVTFWRGTLDKLHVVPQYFMMKEYKSAGEPMSRYEMSPYFREELSDLLGDIWGWFQNEIATRRKLDPEAVEAATGRGVMTGAETLASKMVDELGYEEDVREALRKAAGTDEYVGLSLRKYIARKRFDAHQDGAKKVAVVFGSGVIAASGEASPFDDERFSGPRVARAVREAADDDSIHAILLRVNSPGGSPVGSDHVWRAVEYARKTKKKTVVVSMSTLAASGGYWVSMNSDAIVAEPTTITGSIGVVFGKLNLRGLYEMAGARVDTVGVGRNSDLWSLVESFNPEQEKRMIEWMTQIYDDFKHRVAEGRGLEEAFVEDVARGRVWSGRAALERKLVDRLGGYDEAIKVLREKARIPDSERVELVVYPRTRSFVELLFSEDVALEARVRLGLLDPAKRLEQSLSDLTRPGAWLIAPIQVQ